MTMTNEITKDRTPILRYLKKNLERNRGRWPAIARHADVSYSWIIHVMNGTTPNPQVNQVQAVVDVLWKLEDGLIEL